MKNLIRISIVLFLISIATESFTQRYCIKGGMNLSNMLMKDNDDNYSDEFKMKPGFHLGGTVEFPISEMISFETGLLLSTKGFRLDEKETSGSNTYEYKLNLNLLYLDIPVTAKASFDVGDTKIYGIFGPYIGIGLTGKSKSEYTYDGETETDEEDIKFGSDEDEDDFKRFDFGLTIGGGVEIKSIQIGLSYSLGLANISLYTDNGFKINNRVLGISVGYIFGGK